MKRPQIQNKRYSGKDFMNGPYNLPRYSDDLNKYIDQLEAKQKDLITCLEAIKTHTADSESPLLKVIHEIAHKTLKSENK